ncbi:MAG TPA: TIR domain-containing protein [Novosphingobium sp.]|nr:TIR domain-containing protein [Novosphingobium sp.]
MNSVTDADGAAGSRPSVFLSYARADQKRARQVIGVLEQAGLRVWWDGLLEGGETFLPTTEAALESADAVVVLWTRTSVDSHWVRDEATRGRERGCLVPVSLDGSHAPLGFRQFQAINLQKWRGKADAPEIQAVIRAVLGFAGQPHPAPAARTAKGPTRRGLLIGAGTAAAALAGGFALWRGLAPGAAQAAENTIAVIPFTNLGATENYFSAGLSEELRATLARNRMLRIAAPTSSAEFRGDKGDDVLTIAKRLGVAHVLRGSVRQEAGQIRVSVELLDGHDAGVDWSVQLDRQASDVLALQTEIAVAVSKALASAISALAVAEGRSGDLALLGGTGNAKAFDAFLRGKALADQSKDEATDRAALERFDAAVALDGKYARALAARAKILAVIANETGQSAEIPGLYDRSVQSAEAAIRAAPELAEAHTALGYTLYNGRLDPKAARAPYDRSRELGAGDADVLRTFALYTAYTGRPAEAAEAIGTALELDPLNHGAFRAAGYIAYARRDFADTVVQMRKALELSPKLSAVNSAIGTALYLQGQLADADAAFAAEPLELFRLQGQAMVRQRTGDKAGAQQALTLLSSRYGRNSNYQQAQVLAQWGDRAGALDRLEKAAAARDAGLLLAGADALLDPVRSDPRFAELLSRLGLS